ISIICCHFVSSPFCNRPAAVSHFALNNSTPSQGTSVIWGTDHLHFDRTPVCSNPERCWLPKPSPWSRFELSVIVHQNGGCFMVGEGNGVVRTDDENSVVDNAEDGFE
ncbi:MAG: hypothetical protein PHI06_09595, partial [Desulfobulbaceae bacterium]|nr:hypothetical protein [Desulfobulbaceae bacterium]